jgi:porin
MAKERLSGQKASITKIPATRTGLAAAALLCATAAPAADDVDIRRRETLSNGFSGMTSVLAERGIEFGTVYTSEIAQVSGGLKNGHTYQDNTDITLQADMGRLIGADGGTFFLYILGNSGRSPSRYAGDMQAISNIDAPDTWKLYELWYQQNWADGRYSLKAGLYDFNSEFDAMETAGLFVNSSFGIGPDVAQSGENGPSIFPTTSLALRGQLNFDGGVYLQTAVFDGVPGHRDRPHGTHIHLDRGDGLFLAAEVGHVRAADADANGYRKWALGTWRYTTAMKENAAGAAISPRENRGIYALVESAIWHEADAPEQGLAGFLRYGVADKRVNQLDAYVGGGLVYTGLFRGRDDDQFGIAVARAMNANRFRREMALQGAPVGSGETAVEMNYRVQITPWLVLQPDYQYIIDPSADAAIDDAHVMMLRLELAL